MARLARHRLDGGSWGPTGTETPCRGPCCRTSRELIVCLSVVPAEKSCRRQRRHCTSHNESSARHNIGALDAIAAAIRVESDCSSFFSHCATSYAGLRQLLAFSCKPTQCICMQQRVCALQVDPEQIIEDSSRQRSAAVHDLPIEAPSRALRRFAVQIESETHHLQGN